MRSEDGINSGFRNAGRLALALVPWALGIGALAWLSFYIGVHDVRHQLTQEQRAAVYTGATVRPKSVIAVEMENSGYGCITITRADVDGSSLILYGRNDCTYRVSYTEWHWQEISPNGVVIHQGYTNQCAEPTNPGDVAECKFSWSNFDGIETDSRTDKLRVWAQEHPF